METPSLQISEISVHIATCNFQCLFCGTQVRKGDAFLLDKEGYSHCMNELPARSLVPCKAKEVKTPQTIID